MPETTTVVDLVQVAAPFLAVGVAYFRIKESRKMRNEIMKKRTELEKLRKLISKLRSSTKK